MLRLTTQCCSAVRLFEAVGEGMGKIDRISQAAPCAVHVVEDRMPVQVDEHQPCAGATPMWVPVEAPLPAAIPATCVPCPGGMSRSGFSGSCLTTTRPSSPRNSASICSRVYSTPQPYFAGDCSLPRGFSSWSYRKATRVLPSAGWRSREPEVEPVVDDSDHHAVALLLAILQGGRPSQPRMLATDSSRSGLP